MHAIAAGRSSGGAPRQGSRDEEPIKFGGGRYVKEFLPFFEVS
jgi:hypothetical protein